MATGLFPTRGGRGGPRPGYVPKNRRVQPADILDRFADYLAEGDRPETAASKLGKSPAYGRVLLAKIRKELGWQAR